MAETEASVLKRPGIVLFVAVLNFIGAGVSAIWFGLCAVALLFGNAMGVYQAVMAQVSKNMPNLNTANLNLGLNLILIVLMIFAAVFGTLAIWIGLSLLKGKRFAWYVQVAFSVLGLFGFPIGTILNTVILIFFFQHATRDYFKV